MAAVCARWRGVVISTPRVWSYLCSKLPSEEVQLYITRSRESPLDIKFHNSWSKRFVPQIFRYIHRFRTLQASSQDFIELAERALEEGHAPLLESFSVCSPNTPSNRTVRGVKLFKHALHLRKLEIARSCSISIEWESVYRLSKLTHLTICDLGEEEEGSLIGAQYHRLFKSLPCLEKVSINARQRAKPLAVSTEAIGKYDRIIHENLWSLSLSEISSTLALTVASFLYPTSCYFVNATFFKWSMEPIDPETSIQLPKGNRPYSGPSTVMPPEPKLFGRTEYIEKAVKLLFSITGAKIAILGPGGMGKTSVALKIIYDALVVDRFGDNRCWIPCEQATSVPLLLELIAKSLNLSSSSSNDRLADIIKFLRTSKLLYILLFDNFETPWDIEGQQSNVADVLATIASIPTVSFIITMRGNQHPSSNTIEWTEPRLPSLTQLDLDAAEEAFARISPNAKREAELRTLLEKLDCMPLAITLMAKLSEAGETVAELLEQWKLERTRLLDQPGGDRRNSIEVSIKLSLESRSVRGNSDALRLLGVLAMLPAGAALARLPDMCPSIPGWKAALRVLRGAA
ncbi:hypothetical protein FRC03_006574, partial [Tulasnella sp. 419]